MIYIGLVLGPRTIYRIIYNICVYSFCLVVVYNDTLLASHRDGNHRICQ